MSLAHFASSSSPFFCCFSCFCFFIFKFFQRAVLQSAKQVQDLQLKRLGDPFLGPVSTLYCLQLTSKWKEKSKPIRSSISKFCLKYNTASVNALSFCFFFLNRKSLPCFDFDIFQVFLLLQEEVVLFRKLRFQFSYPFLRSIEPLALLLNTQFCFLQFLSKSSMQHFNLLKGKNTALSINLIVCYFY